MKQTRRDLLGLFGTIASMSGLALLGGEVLTKGQVIRLPESKQSIALYLDTYPDSPHAESCIRFGREAEMKIVMPCGYELPLNSSADIPRHDVLCPCGNPSHILIKWKSRSNNA